jgi:hypothetical protein
MRNNRGWRSLKWVISPPHASQGRKGVLELPEFEGAFAPIDLMSPLLSKQAAEGQNRPVKKDANRAAWSKRF